MSRTVSTAMQEQLLQSWINMSLVIRGNRMVSGLSFNEMIICRILYEKRNAGQPAATATELCQQMQLLKSQINKLLTTMEGNGLIVRQRSDADKRKIEIRLTDHAVRLYETEHARILKILEHVSDHLGAEQTETLTYLLKELVNSIRSMPFSESERNQHER